MKHAVRAVLFLCLLVGAMSAAGRDLPPFDAVAKSRVIPNAEAALVQRTAAYVRTGTRAQGDNRFGVPTFLWAGRSVDAPALRQGPVAGSPQEAAARVHLGNYAELYNLSAQDVTTATVRYVHDIGKGPVIVKFIQKVAGVEVLLEELSVVMNRELDLVAISGFISSTATPSAQLGAAWSLDAAQGAAAAYKDLTGRDLDPKQLVAAGSRDGYDFFAGAKDIGLDIPIRIRRVYYHLPEGLVPAYHAEVAIRNQPAEGELREAPSGDLDYYAYVISAHDGSLLLRRNLASHAEAAGTTRARGRARASLGGGGFTYRVWADPITKIPLDGPQGNDFHPKLNPVNDNAQPTLIPSDLVTLANYPFSMNDPWLPPGSTETVGNNVDAYVDLVNPNGFGVTGPPASGISNDFRGQITAPDVFANNYDTTVRPNDATQRLAAVQQMFYNVNFLHDWFYDYGFDEASLNAQTDNFGRGGLGNDPINAEGQDMSNLDNANMNTPADGARPRMQMFIFQAQANAIVANPPGQAPSTNDGRFIQIQSPASIATVIGTGTVQFGQQPYDLTNDLVLANPPAACTALTNAAAVSGRIVLVERQATGGPVCALQTKIAHAQNAGAVGFLLINNQATPTTGVSFLGFINTGPLGVPANGPVTMAMGTMSWNQALPIKAELAVPNTVTARIKRDIDRDGTIDTQVMMHEWGHYLQNRVIGNSLGLINNQGGGMGEGWGDFTALLFTVREDDILVPSNADWNGVYSMASYVLTGGATSQGAYFGIRRYPQTTDMTKNPLTLRHIVDGEPLPPGIPFVPKAAANSQVHNTGEVWSVTLWECYAALLRDTVGPNPRLTFEQARDRMNTYYIASLKMTPLRPTLLSARDAMLAAAYAHDAVDYARFWQAFARRGYGINAVAADPYSTNHVGTVEDFTVGGQLLFQGAELNTGTADCDADGILDSGDTVALDVTLRNVGDGTLSATTGVVSSSDPNVTFPGGGTITFSESEPFEASIGSTAISYAAAIAGIQTIPIQISFEDPDLAVPGPRIVNLNLRVNTNTILNSTATDTVESERLAQTPTVVTGTFPNFSTNTPWRRNEASATDHKWFGTDPDAMQDQALVSPVMTVNGSGSLIVEFDHSWGFEFDGGGNYDGGVVEMSVNGGSWNDIGVGGVNSYNGTILNQGPTSNPLGGRAGFVQNSPGTVHTTLTQAIAPGSTVQVRFRLGSDQIFGGAGWNVDNIGFTGVVETPFDTVVADPGCGAPPATTVTLASSANPSPFANNLTLTATVASTSGSPSGSVTFFDGVTSLGSAPVVAGVANLVTSALATGAHSLTASYSGDFGPATSAPFAQTINKAASSTQVESSLNPTTIGQAVTFTADVGGAVGTPTGTVTFFDGATLLGAKALVDGDAALTTTGVSCGTRTIHANYEGSATYATSTDSLVQTVFDPTAPVATNGGPYCEGGTIQLSTPDVPGATYAWTGPNGFTSTNREPTIPATAAAAGIYEVRVTLAGCTTVPGSTTVVVNATPATPTASNGGPYCEGSTISLSTPTVAGATYAWTGPNGFTSSDQNPTRTNATLADAGVYSVTVTVDDCPSAAGTTTVVVNPVPATPTATNGGPYIAGQTITLSTPDVPGATYAWTGPNGFTSSDREPTIPNATLAAAGTYSVMVTVDGCTSAAGTTDVVVQAGVFYALTPCRLLDTRQVGQGPPLSNGVPRILTVTGGCGVPAGAMAVAINVTIVPTASGHLAAYPGDQALPPTSMLNFNAGRTRANNGIIPLASDSSGTLAFRAVILDSGTAHLIVDVMGYFTLEGPSGDAAGGNFE